MQKILIILLLFPIPLLLHGNSWESGFVINNKGDTIQGQIKNKGNLHSGIYFRFDETKEVLRYSPENIRAFSINGGKFYISKEIESSRYFLEYLIKGVASIYCIKIEGKSKYYIEKENNLVLLKNSQLEINERGRSLLNPRNEYMGVLNYILADADMRERIEETDLSHISLIQLSIDYHHRVCSDNSCIVYEKKYRDLFSYFLGLGWEKGYLLDVSGMRIEGYIQLKNKFEGSLIRFKMQFYDKSYIEYFPNEIEEVHLENGDHYVSKEIERDKKYFLKLIFRSEVNLYYIDISGDNSFINYDRFFIEKDNRLIELKNSMEILYRSGGKDIINEKKEYLGLLIYLLSNADIKEQILKTEYDQTSFINLIKLYNTKIN